MSASRTRLFDPSSSEPFALSRSKVQLFLDCPRCFYLDRKEGIGRPDNAAYSLNLAVDALLKREFDQYRLDAAPHPLMTMYGVDAIPFRHNDLSIWRDTPTGIRVLHSATNFEVFGIVDDIWVHPDGSLAVVDYKATSTLASISLDDRDGYKRQMEVYQWLLRQKGFTVSDTAFFVFANARKDGDAFDRKLEFTLQVLPYEGSDSWVDDALIALKECLVSDVPPPSVEGCEWCQYRKSAQTVEN